MRDPDYVLSPLTIVDEQTKAAGMRASALSATSAATTAALSKSPDELLLDRVNAQIATTQAKLTDVYASQGLNPDGSITNARGTVTAQPGTGLFNSIKAANDRVAADAALKESTKPTTPAPQGFFYTWHVFPAGGGEWRLVQATFGPTAATTPTITPVVTPVIGTGNGNGNSNGSNLVTGTSTTTAPTGPTLASDVFKQTLAIFFGASEMAKPWVNELYTVVSKFYKQGATSEEAFNMAVLDSRNNPALGEFTKRFKGIYALQDMKQAGKAVTVPTIAEYFATEAKMGDVLKQSNLGDLANEDFLGDVLAKGVSATEFANRITAIFDRIDNAPKDIKNTISRYFPTVDRLSLAKAIALGDKGAKELQSQVAGYEVLSAAEKQGLSAGQLVGGTTVESAYQYALGGETYDTALTKFGTVAAMLPTVNKLTQVYGEETLGQAGVESAVFGKSAKEIKRLEDLAKKEEASFSGRSGVSQVSLASQRRGSGLI
jgi:hypothetical protein